MAPPSSLRPALVAVAAALLTVLPVLWPGWPGGGPGPAAAAAPAEPRTPLEVRIGSLSPSTIPRRGPVRVTGTVTNRDDVAWTSVRVYPFVSDDPISSRGDLAEAAEVDVTAPVGARILVPGSYDTLGRIYPGQTVAYSLRVPRDSLPEEPGVYWFGAHALGQGDGPVETVPTADGRARTFLPLVRRRAGTVETSLVLPLRRPVHHSVTGAVADVHEWARTLRPGGRLWELLDLVAAAEPGQLSLLVDPAVLDAVTRLAAGNPDRSLEPTLTQPGGEDDGDAETPDEPAAESTEESSPTPDAELLPSPPETGEGESGEGQPDAPEEELDPVEEAAAEAAGRWLERFRGTVGRAEVLALPYGDVDVAAAAEHDPSLYRLARSRSEASMTARDIEATPAVAPLGGFLDEAGLALVDPGTRLLVSARMVPGGATVVRSAGRTLLTTSTGARAGGPGPEPARSALALRQRIVAEAALRARRTGGSLVVMLPHTWTPGDTAGFLEGLSSRWQRLTGTGDVAGEPADPVPAERLRYPPRRERLELGPEHFAAATSLISTGEALQNVLSRNDEVASVIAAEALSGLSYFDRSRRGTAPLGLVAARTRIEELLASIEITAPRGVTLSSSSGRFAVTLGNGLDEQVTVQVQTLADDPLEVAATGPVTIAPGGRTSVLLEASTDRLGVHSATLVVTDIEGTPLGSTDRLPVRSAQVSQVIWLIIGAGAGLLLGAIVLRLVRRVRAHRGRAAASAGAAPQSPDPESDPEPGGRP